MSNPYKRLIGLISPAAVNVGEVIATHADGATVELPTGATLRVRGQAAIGDHVYIRDQAIEGPAPALTGAEIEI